MRHDSHIKLHESYSDKKGPRVKTLLAIYFDLVVLRANSSLKEIGHSLSLKFIPTMNFLNV